MQMRKENLLEAICGILVFMVGLVTGATIEDANASVPARASNDIEIGAKHNVRYEQVYVDGSRFIIFYSDDGTDIEVVKR